METGWRAQRGGRRKAEADEAEGRCVARRGGCTEPRARCLALAQSRTGMGAERVTTQVATF
jgi:hypothetical protein